MGAVRGTPHLGPEVTTVFGGNADASIAGNAQPPQQIALVARRGAEQHIHILSAVASPGIWLPDTTAAQLHAVAGSVLDLRVGAAVLPIAVHGIFRDLLLERDQFWCSLQPQIEVFGNATTPPVAVVDQPQLIERSLQHTDKGSVTAWWEFPPDARNWTMSAARAVRAHLGSVAASSEDPDSRLAKAVGEGPAHFDLPASIQHAEQTEAAVASAVGPVSLASVAVALLVIIAASGTWLERRRVELRVLAIRGASPGALAAKAMLELSVPTLVGAAAGLTVAVSTVRWFGPSAVAEPRALLVATVSALVAALLGVAVGAVVVATRVRNLDVRSGVLGEKERLPALSGPGAGRAASRVVNSGGAVDRCIDTWTVFLVDVFNGTRSCAHAVLMPGDRFPICSLGYVALF